MRAIGGARVAHILVSHTHRDHSPAPACCRRGPARRSSPPGRIGRRGRREPAKSSASTPAPIAISSPDAMLADGEHRRGTRLSARGRGDARAMPPTISPSRSPATDILFSGDHVMGWSTTVVAPPDGSMADYMASLDRLLAGRRRSTCRRMAARSATRTPTCAALRAHRQDARSARSSSGLRRGDRTIPELVARVYQGLDPRLPAPRRSPPRASGGPLCARRCVDRRGRAAARSTRRYRRGRRLRRGASRRAPAEAPNQAPRRKLLMRRAFWPRSCSPSATPSACRPPCRRGRRAGARPRRRGSRRRESAPAPRASPGRRHGGAAGRRQHDRPGRTSVAIPPRDCVMTLFSASAWISSSSSATACAGAPLVGSDVRVRRRDDGPAVCPR